MEIKKENILRALNTGSESVKETIYALFPDIKEEEAQRAANRPVTERIKTFEDALNELGEQHAFVAAYRIASQSDAFGVDGMAYLKLRIIIAALNEGWQPKFTEDEWRYYPWFTLWTEEELEQKSEDWKKDRHLIEIGEKYVSDYAGFAYAYSGYAPSSAFASFGSRLCLKSDTLATYCGKQFIELWADFYLTPDRDYLPF